MPGAGDRFPEMSEYDRKQWERLSAYWGKRANRRGHPNWLHDSGAFLARTAHDASHAVVEKVPDGLKDAATRATEAVTTKAAPVLDKAAAPALHELVHLLELLDDWAMELNDPVAVVRIAQRKGLTIDSFEDLRSQDLKTCDRLLTKNALAWRTVGAVEGGLSGALATAVPVIGTAAAIFIDIVVLQVMSVSIASRIAYSYGYDAKDPDEREFIEKLLRWTLTNQAAKATPVAEAGKASALLHGRRRWSAKLRENSRLIEVLERLINKYLMPQGSRIAVASMDKVVWGFAIVVSAGVNSHVLGATAKSAQRMCRTRFLCARYGLPRPAPLASLEDPTDSGDDGPGDDD